MKTELNSITLGVNEKLIDYVKQLKEMVGYVQELNKIKEKDKDLTEMLNKAENHIYNAAYNIGDIIGKETFSNVFHGMSNFEPKK